MYVYRPEERFKSPPILPPHLLQVILNKDTNISVGTSVLPTHREPPGGWKRSPVSPWLGPGLWHFLGKASLFPLTTLVWACALPGA